MVIREIQKRGGEPDAITGAPFVADIRPLKKAGSWKQSGAGELQAVGTSWNAKKGRSRKSVTKKEETIRTVRTLKKGLKRARST